MLLGRHPLWGAGATLILKSWVKALPKEQLSCHIYFVYAPAHGGLPAQLSGGLCKSLGFISDPLLVVNLSAGPVTLWELLGPLLHVIGDARAFLTLLHNTRLQLLPESTATAADRLRERQWKVGALISYPTTAGSRRSPFRLGMIGLC